MICTKGEILGSRAVAFNLPISWGRGYLKLKKLTKLPCKKIFILSLLLPDVSWVTVSCCICYSLCMWAASFSGQGLSFAACLCSALVLPGTPRAYHSIDQFSCNWWEWFLMRMHKQPEESSWLFYIHVRSPVLTAVEIKQLKLQMLIKTLISHRKHIFWINQCGNFFSD